MFEDLIRLHQELGRTLAGDYQKLGHMLADAEENVVSDAHPEDVAEILHNSQLVAEQLVQEIAARRQYILNEVLPGWELTHSGQDAGMPPGTPPGPADGLS